MQPAAVDQEMRACARTWVHIHTNLDAHKLAFTRAHTHTNVHATTPKPTSMAMPGSVIYKTIIYLIFKLRWCLTTTAVLVHTAFIPEVISILPHEGYSNL